MGWDDKIKFERGKKFDIQLAAALINERKLAWLFGDAKLTKVELKSESWLWERSGNIAIEYASRGKLSGISTTEADFWVHELKRDDETLCYLMFPIDRLRELVADARLAGHVRTFAGDDSMQELALIRCDILR
jgi:hypothetical protein